MRVLAFARDPGGANVVIPVTKALLDTKHHTVSLFGQDWARSIFRRYGLHARPFSKVSFARALRSGTDVVITGTSWPPEKEIVIWDMAHQAGVPTVAVLDFWSNYRARFSDKRGRPHWPNFITAMDGTARREMLADGIPADRVVITGQPFLEMRARELRTAALAHRPKDNRSVLFLSQPLSKNPNSKKLPFDEFSVLELVSKALEDLPRHKYRNMSFVLRPHPKDDLPKLRAILKRYLHHVPWSVQKGDGTDLAILQSHVVVGIYTMLLVECVLAGRPIISVQPGWPQPDPFLLSRLKYVARVGDRSSLTAALQKALRSKTTHSSRQFIRPHRGATQRVIHLLKQAACEPKARCTS